MNTKRMTFLLIGSALILTGCSQQTINSATHDAQHDVAVVDKAAQKAAGDAKPQLKKLDLGARVQTALVAAHIHGIRVDADTNGVSLHGTVATKAEKERASQVAKDTLGSGKSVDNEIKVSG